MAKFAFAVLTLLSACATAPAFDTLPPVGTAQPELRIRIAHYPLALQSAYVVRPDEIASYQYNGTRWRGRVHKTNAANRILDAGGALARLDGADVACDVEDGEAIWIEGTVAGRHFALTASNPDACDDPSALQVRQVLVMVDEAAPN